MDATTLPVTGLEELEAHLDDILADPSTLWKASQTPQCTTDDSVWEATKGMSLYTDSECYILNISISHFSGTRLLHLRQFRLYGMIFHP